ncbi:hypothetical protein SLEP1_g24323 [Rubroshorea leprosula]|uniref:Uncharacterized protein n=1 Tax=Rubroshorea leprosula TaxID=152421 RepID=A0AAV5JFJ6_9ROSI|nr:hypothetical protein SLEP1_g24323 [Rubroshorea leprosula]
MTFRDLLFWPKLGFSMAVRGIGNHLYVFLNILSP